MYATFFLWSVTALVPWMVPLACGSGQNADLYMVKTDSEGRFLWSRTLGGPAWDYATAVHETGDGGYVLAGSTNSFGAGDQDILLVRLDAQGTVLWSAIFGGPADERAEGLSISPTGDILVFGTTDSYGAGSGDLYLVKTDENGDEIWSRTYGGAGVETGAAMDRTKDGGFVLVGTTRSFGSGKKDVYLVRINGSGDQIWDNHYGTEAHDVAYGVKETTDGGFIMVGATEGTDSGTWDVYMIRTDAQGEEIWHRTWDDGGYEVGYSVMEAEDLGFFVSGYKDPFGSDKWDVLLIRTDEDGRFIWSTTYGEAGNDRADAMLRATDGDLIIAGSTDGSGSNGWDMYLLRISEDGNELWGSTYGGGDTEGAECVIQTHDGGFLMAGGTYSFGTEMVSLAPVKRSSPPTPGNRPLSPILSVTENSFGVTLTWTSSPLADSYSLLYSPADGSYLGNFDVGTRTTFSINLWRGAAFYVAVEAHVASGATALSNIQYVLIE